MKIIEPQLGLICLFTFSNASLLRAPGNHTFNNPVLDETSPRYVVDRYSNSGDSPIAEQSPPEQHVRRRTTVTLRTIYGYVRDNRGQPVSNVRVTAFDADVGNDQFMGRVMTDSRGYYEIHYNGGHWDDCPHEWDCWRPDIFVTVSVRRWKITGPL